MFIPYNLQKQLIKRNTQHYILSYLVAARRLWRSWVITMVRIILVNRVLFHARDYHRILINSAQEVKVEIPQNFGMMGRLYYGHWFLAAEKKENLLWCFELLNASGSDHDNMEYYYGFDLYYHIGWNIVQGPSIYKRGHIFIILKAVIIASNQLDSSESSVKTNNIYFQ